MSQEVAQVQSQASRDLTVSYSDTAVAEMKKQRDGLKKFVASQMRKETDFGVIPGTQKASLFKPGAEKLANLFQLGSRIIAKDKEIDLKNNFAMFSTTVEVFHIPSGKAIAQCEGVCNSFEKKYKSRSIYEYNPSTRRKEKVGEEDTPIGDVMNTLNKMALKRAYVGAVIMAVGASDFFTQDLEDDDAGVLTNKQEEQKPAAPSFDEPTQGGGPGDYVVPFGRSKGVALRDLPVEEVRSSIQYWKGVAEKDKKPLKGQAAEFMKNAEAYIGGL